MAANSVELQILANTEKAIKSINGFSNTTQRSVAGIEKSFSALKAVAGVAVGVLAGRAVINGIKTVTNAASVQEDAINNLNTALRLSGEFSEAASRDMQAFASSIQATTKFGDEAILQQLSLAKAFGATNDQAKQITQAAVELAAATGKSLDEATRQVSKTLGGFAGELGEVNPRIKALTAEQLKAGEAAKILIEQYGGSAAGQINTFSGALTQTENLFGDLLEEIGFLITKNPIVIEGIKLLGSAFTTLGNFIKDNRDTITDFTNRVLVGLIDAFVFVGRVMKPIFSVLASLAAIFVKIAAKLHLARIAVTEFALSFESVQKVINVVADAFRFMAFAITDAIGNIVKLLAMLPGVGSDLDGIIGSLDKVRNGFAESFGSDVTATIRKNLEVQKQFAKTIDQEAFGAVDKLKDGFDETLESASKFARGIESAAGKSTEALQNIALGGKPGAPGSPSGGSSTSASTPDGASAEASAAADKVAQESASSVGFSILDAFDQGSSLFLDAMQGGFIERTIAAFSSITELPAKFSEFSSKLGDIGLQLVDGLAGAFDGLIASIPKIATKLVETFNKIVDLVVKKGPALFSALVDAALTFVEAIVKALPKLIAIIPKLVDKLAQSLPKLLRIILQGLPAIITAIARALPQIVRSIAAAIPEIVIVFAENIAPVVLALVQGIIEAAPAIVFALVDEFILKGGIFRIIGAIIKALPQVVVALVQGITRGLSTNLGAAFGDFGKIFSANIKFPKLKLGSIDQLKDVLSGKTFISKLSDLFGNPPFLKKLQEVFDKFNPGKAFGGGGGGGKGPVTGIPGSPLATGGLVPPGFPNDTFPARLTSGELVIPPGDVGRLSRFLDRAEAGGSAAIDYNKLAAALESRPVEVSVQIGDQQLTRAIVKARNKGFRI